MPVEAIGRAPIWVAIAARVLSSVWVPVFDLKDPLGPSGGPSEACEMIGVAAHNPPVGGSAAAGGTMDIGGPRGAPSGMTSACLRNRRPAALTLSWRMRSAFPLPGLGRAPLYATVFRS